MSLPSHSKKVFFIDAYALIFRGYYAFIKNPRINTKGQDTSAILGFFNTVFDIIKRDAPTHLAVVFDKGGSDYRKEMYEDYKANRLKTPEPIVDAVPYIKAILEAMNIKIVEQEGYEADDLIGTLVKKAEQKGFTSYMITPDKDFAQLVSDNIFMYKPSKMGSGIEILGPKEVQEAFEINHPNQIIDLLAMMGDASDNIPGLPGVGQKTAVKLLKTYGNLEELLDRANEIQGKLGEKIRDHADQGLLSKKLTTIMMDAPVDFVEEDFSTKTPNHQAVIVIFEELELARLQQQYQKMYPHGPSSMRPLDLFSEPKSTKEAQLEAVFQQLTLPKGIELLIQKIKQSTIIALDLLDLEGDQGLSICLEEGISFFISRDQAHPILELLFASDHIKKVVLDLKSFMYKMSKWDIHHFPDSRVFLDVSLVIYVLNPSVSQDLSVQTQQLLKKQITFSGVIDHWEASAKQAHILWCLEKPLTNRLQEEGLSSLYEEIELPLVPILYSMERKGLFLDVSDLEILSKDINQRLFELERDIYQHAGVKFNISSTKQLGSILFDQLKIIEKPKKTKTKKYSTSEDNLRKLIDKHPIISLVLEWRQMLKMKNTYVDVLPRQVDFQTHRIHTQFLQKITSTGRLSSRDPNLQNIPVRTDFGKKVRSAFKPQYPEYLMLAADYSQIELRIMASLSGDEKMIASFHEGIDIHSATASRVYQIPLSEVSKDQRNKAKTINFGIIYGVSAFGLSHQTTLTQKESKELIDRYYDTYTGLKSYIDKQVAFTRAHGYAETLFGRRRYLPGIDSKNYLLRTESERNAVNMPIQGTAADIIKKAMISIYRDMIEKKMSSKMLLQVHDELVFEVHPSELADLEQMVSFEMSTVCKLSVPLDVNIGVGPNWFLAH